MLKRVLFRAAAVLAVLGLGGSAKADFVIDNFSVPPIGTAYNQLIALDGTQFSATDTSAPGVTRQANVNVLSDVLGGGTARVRLGAFGGGNTFSLSTDDGLTAVARLQYTYATAQNLSAGGTSLQFNFVRADLNTPYSIQITDRDGNTSTQSGTAFSGAGVYSFSTASFTGVDLTHVAGILLSLNRNLQTGGGEVTSADFALSSIGIKADPLPPPPAVPAPPAAVLVLAALPVLGLTRARRLLPA